MFGVAMYLQHTVSNLQHLYKVHHSWLHVHILCALAGMPHVQCIVVYNTFTRDKIHVVHKHVL